MTDLSALYDIAEDAIDNVHDMDVTHRQYAEAVVDAVLRAMPDHIPGLVWMDAGFEQDADLVDTTYTYQIQEAVWWYAAEVNGHVCESNEAAKAAADADYRDRFRAMMGVG